MIWTWEVPKISKEYLVSANVVDSGAEEGSLRSAPALLDVYLN